MRLGETPVPIPNTMVKPFTADGTALATVWESRWMPDQTYRLYLYINRYLCPVENRTLLYLENFIQKYLKMSNAKKILICLCKFTC